MTTCGCRYGANQFSAWFTPCEKHDTIITTVARIKGVSREDFLAEAVRIYTDRILEEKR